MTSTPEPQSHRLLGWKRVALVSFSIGLGLALGLLAIFGVSVWVSSWPRKMNDTALAAKGPPKFFGVRDSIGLRYSLRNATASDYTAESASNLRLYVRLQDSSLALNGGGASVETPVSIPAGESGVLFVYIADSGVPQQSPSQSDSVYHETLRKYLHDGYRYVTGYVLYDDVNHYRVLLPRWDDRPPLSSFVRP